MNNTIYIVLASKEFNYEGSHSSTVLTTFCKDHALSFAKEYDKKANTILQDFMSCDHVSVSVISTLIGTPNTESIIWTSNGFSVSAKDNQNNIRFSINPETSLIDNMTYNQQVNSTNYYRIKPTLSFAVGLSDLNVNTEKHTFDFTQFRFDDFPYVYSTIESDEFLNNTLSKGFTIAINQDAQSNENKKSWELYRLYEQKYFRK